MPLTRALMNFVHSRFLAYFVEQEVIGHMEAEMGRTQAGRLRVAIAFADLAGYTRLTEERGDERR